MSGMKQSILEKAVHKRNNMDHQCEKCGGSTTYSIVMGTYTCNSCGYVEKDNYGRIKDLLEKYPGLSRIEIASVLHISLRDLNEFFENDMLVNPKNSLLG
ncbi:MAG: hypothetical protein IJT16_09255 [Lachnospiraceae bacterium]|nr:hypothetical protein [Lachnospiraceae bacterium]